MKETPILFSGEMVRAILEGRKTQTRRIVKLPHMNPLGQWEPSKLGGTGAYLDKGMTKPAPEHVVIAHSRTGDCIGCPYGQPGDRLWPALAMPGYDKRYCIDMAGSVWSRAKGDWRALSNGVTSKGYATITPAKDGAYRTQLVHRLVCEAFYGPHPVGLDQVRHLNGMSMDNDPNNLDWGTQEQNWQDRATHGRGMGERHHAAKLSSQDVAEIRRSSESQRALARKYGVAQATISEVRLLGTWTPDRKPAPPNLPRWASRITLEITDVRVQRLQEITPKDAIAEGLKGITKDGKLTKYGIPDRDGLPGDDDSGWPWHLWRISPVDAYEALWDSINGKRPGANWNSSPWVWAITFKRT